VCRGCRSIARVRERRGIERAHPAGKTTPPLPRGVPISPPRKPPLPLSSSKEVWYYSS
jgi:hypothetical protein